MLVPVHVIVCVNLPQWQFFLVTGWDEGVMTVSNTIMQYT